MKMLCVSAAPSLGMDGLGGKQRLTGDVSVAPYVRWYTLGRQRRM